MIYFEERVQGLAELDRFLATLPEAIQRKMLNSALRAAGKPVLEQARRNIAQQFGGSPRYTGTLEAGMAISKQKNTGLAARVNIKTRKARGTKSNAVVRGVKKPYGADPFYGRFLEKGTSRMPAQPFLGPAGFSRQGDAGRALNAELQRQIEKWCKANGVKYVPGGV